MTNHVILNNVEHPDLRVITQKSSAFQDNQMCVSLTIGELRDAQRDYPIVFHREPKSGQMYPMALLGFCEGENLFLTDKGWRDAYVPAIIEKGPFRIGKQEQADGGEELLISIDLDDPRVTREQGETLFLPHGGNSDFTLHIADVLNKLHSQREATHAFGQQLDQLELFEPLALEFSLDNKEGVRLSGFYILNEEKLANLNAEHLEQLSKAGFLQGAYFCIASLNNLSRLMQLKQAQ